MKRILLALTLLFALLATAGCGAATRTAPAAGSAQPADSSLSDVQKHGKLEIGMSGQYPPFAYRQEDGKLIGFDIDITTEIARRLGVQPDYVTMPFKGLVAALDASRFDLIANQMAITPERQQRYAFSTPYVQSGSQLLVAKSNTSINSLADVKGKTFAASEGSNYEKILKDAGAKIQYYTNNATIYSDIAAGRIDGDMNDRLQVAYLVEHSGLPLRAAGDPGQKVPVALMFRQGNTTLVNAVNKALADMQADGTFLKISQQWFGQDVSK
ncbi:MAG: transporter substrate-binding domain-containing protein [Mycobacterium leprae]